MAQRTRVAPTLSQLLHSLLDRYQVKNKNTTCCSLNSTLWSRHGASACCVMWDDWAMVSLDIYPDIRCDAEITTDLSLITQYLEWSPARLRGSSRPRSGPGDWSPRRGWAGIAGRAIYC